MISIKIIYNRKYLRGQLFWSVVMLASSIYSIISESTASITYFNLTIGSVVLSNYFLCRWQPYGVIDDQKILKGILIRREIRIEDITRVKMFAGDIEVHSDKRKITFDKSRIDKSVAPEVEEYFRKWILG